MEDDLDTEQPPPDPDDPGIVTPSEDPAEGVSPAQRAVRSGQEGRVARARRSAEELEGRAREGLRRAQEQHASVRLAVQAFERDRARAGGLLAGGLAYRVFLWQIPFALFLVSAFGLAADLAGDDPADLARRAGMTAALSGAIAQAAAASDSARWWLLILGAFLTVWAGRGVYLGVRLVCELAWGTRAGAGSSLVGSLVVAAFGVATVAIQVALPEVTSTLGVPAPVRFLFGLLLASGLSFWVLVLLPRADAPWTAVVPGAVLFGVGVRLLGLAASTYFAFRLDRSSDLYGALGIAIVMMLYLFLLARLFVAGQFLNVTLHRRRAAERG